jgi:hypothetical protein
VTSVPRRPLPTRAARFVARVAVLHGSDWRAHKRVGPIAHGWYMRVERTCAALILLRQAGYGAEAWPMRRAIIEHVLALRWLAERGNEATDVVRRSPAESSRRRQEPVAEAGWSSAGWPIWADVAADGAAATENVTENNMLTNVRLRCEKYGSALTTRPG